MNGDSRHSVAVEVGVAGDRPIIYQVMPHVVDDLLAAMTDPGSGCPSITFITTDDRREVTLSTRNLTSVTRWPAAADWDLVTKLTDSQVATEIQRRAGYEGNVGSRGLRALMIGHPVKTVVWRAKGLADPKYRGAKPRMLLEIADVLTLCGVGWELRLSEN